MNLYLYDEKHENVFSEFNLGELTEREKNLVEDIIKFLDEGMLTTRYKRLVLAEKFTKTFDDGESLIDFE